MRLRLLIATAIVATAALSLTACGTTEAPSGGSSSSSAAITLKDASGTEITLDGPATKVVGTEWNVVESLVSLGVDPVGVSDVKGYNLWDSAVPLTNTPKDIGTRGEPSLDTIAALAPDLIVATTDLTPASVAQLRKIAPVLQVTSADGADQIGQMFTNLDLIAQATGTEDTAKDLKTEFDAKIASGKAALADAGLAGAKFAFADGYFDANQVTIRPYTKTSLVGAVTTELGLSDAWTIEGDAAYGMGSTDVEALTKLGDVQFLYIANDGDGGDVFVDHLATNPIWKSLAFVKAGTVHRIDDGIWMFGGPGSMMAYVDSVVAELTAK
ncbi:iron-siderophore ABC transporter substrate-binding protein [Glaciihabitans sp. dw_435]|uniref:ABC transporter substrate-binding protein n=1 Tax=Glaciihabitans sp. dw_435 TaxID=2720081 RepID=UPI001BD64D97|nr:iron-siderophore ABC transporter substrate-binding protein [Glaciihabitans sp. dw_435]